MSSTAGPLHLQPDRTLAVAAVVSADAYTRRWTSRHLRDAGFRVVADPADDALIVVIDPADAVGRLGQIRLLAGRHARSPLLAVAPDDAPHALLRRILVAGARGIVLEGEAERTLVPTAHAMLAGQLAVPAALGREIAPRPLSHREKQILGLVVLGMTNREIAGKLFLAESTVKTHLSSAFRKIDARSRAEAVARIQDPAERHGAGVLATVEGLGA